MKTSKYFSDNVVYFLAICVALSFLLQIFNFNAAVDIVYIASLLVVFFCYVCSGFFNKITFIMTLFIALASIANGFRYNVLDYYTHILISLCMYMCLDVSAHIKLKVSTFKRISNLFFITTVILLAAYYFGPLKTTYFNYEIGSVSLNFANPNAAGIWLTCIFILLVYSSFLFRRIRKIMYLGAAIGILPIILATQSRNSFLAALLFIIGIIATKLFRIKRVPNFILLILAVLPLIVFFFYMFVIVENLDFWANLFSISGIEKGLGTRVRVWQNVIDDFGHCFLVGDYYKYYNSQMHNSLLTIFCRFGAACTVLSCVSIYNSLKKLQDSSSFFAALSLSAIFFTGCFETSIFIGIAGLYLMVLLIPACASVENIDNSQQ